MLNEMIARLFEMYDPYNEMTARLFEIYDPYIFSLNCSFSLFPLYNTLFLSFTVF